MNTIKAFFRQFKEETLMIPLLMVLVEFLRRLFMHYFPEMGTFIPEAELFIFLVKVWQLLWITSATWLVLRIVFPAAYFNLIDTFNFYSSSFDTAQDNRRSYFSLVLFIALFFGLIMLFNGASGANREQMLRTRLCDTLSKQLYVRELTGNNDGVEVERYLKSVGAKKGQSWCAAYVSYNLNAYQITNPNSAWSPAFANPKHKVLKAQPGDVGTIYYSNLKRVGHVFFIVDNTHGYYVTNEGNTGSGGVREGGGVHSYYRRVQSVYSISNYITPKFTSNEKVTAVTGPDRLYVYELPHKAENSKKQGNDSGIERYFINYYFSYLQRYNVACDWRQFVNPFTNGQLRESNTSNSGNSSYKISCYKGWEQNINKLPVQGFGSKSQINGKENNGVPGHDQLYGYEGSIDNKGNKGGALFTSLVHRINGGWCNKYAALDFTLCAKISKTFININRNHCWWPILACDLTVHGRNIG